MNGLDSLNEARAMFLYDQPTRMDERNGDTLLSLIQFALDRGELVNDLEQTFLPVMRNIQPIGAVLKKTIAHTEYTLRYVRRTVPLKIFLLYSKISKIMVFLRFPISHLSLV